MRPLLCALFLLLLSGPAAAAQQPCVVLLHGLLRSASIMDSLETAVKSQGYLSVNIDYASRQAPIEELAPIAIEAGLAACRTGAAQPVHFITHSMGGILLRAYLGGHKIPELANSVMIAPPNQGSEVIDSLGKLPGIRDIIGPAGLQLATGADGLPCRLGPADFPVGIIAGNRSYNWLFSPLLPEADDGRVALYSTRLDGMLDYLVLPYDHTALLDAPRTVAQTLFFLRHGHFERKRLSAFTD